jgi:NAD(P)-dependent dehydrogenase (short-subunit alcohol dehydrogenase family)
MSTATSDDEPSLGPDEIQTCVRVLRAIAADRAHLVRLSQAERRELLTLAGLVAKPERHELVRMAKAFRRAERQAAREHDRRLVDRTGQRIQRRATTYAPLWLETPEPEVVDDRGELRQELACYVCKQRFTRVHRYYDSLCAVCGDFNYAKRTQSADLTGHHALITGARVKIGYQTALKLLRAGAHVVVTTRFPVDAADRYSRESDFPEFSRRLQIHGLDLRHAPSVEIFTRFLIERLPRLDYLINNACQTVRRPPAFFQHLLARESAAPASLPATWRTLLASHAELSRLVAPGADALDTPADAHVAGAHVAGAHVAGALVAGAARTRADGILHSAALSQRRYLDDDFRGGGSLFPEGRYDEDRQQVDLRAVNSWRLRLHEVTTAELLEVQFVNAIAPYILNARLKPLLAATPGGHKHIVNVSAMEGQFYRTTKTDKHPHTNMAKAALNMMTRTSAADFLKDGIHMNAVDTGWVTDEDPEIHAARKAELGFAPPLDIIDGAARILDPIFAGNITGKHVWGQFLKDYAPAPW